MDDAIGRKVAELNQILPGGSLRVLLLAYERELISGAEVQELVSQLLKAGLYVGAEVVRTIPGIIQGIGTEGEITRNKEQTATIFYNSSVTNTYVRLETYAQKCTYTTTTFIYHQCIIIHQRGIFIHFKCMKANLPEL